MGTSDTGMRHLQRLVPALITVTPACQTSYTGRNDYRYTIYDGTLSWAIWATCTAKAKDVIDSIAETATLLRDFKEDKVGGAHDRGRLMHSNLINLK
jgi:hypothetical protein